VWGLDDGGVMSWRATDLGGYEAKQRAEDMNVVFDQYGERAENERREINSPVTVESASDFVAGQVGVVNLDGCVGGIANHNEVSVADVAAALDEHYGANDGPGVAAVNVRADRSPEVLAGVSGVAVD
jgi:hypothetical protein